MKYLLLSQAIGYPKNVSEIEPKDYTLYVKECDQFTHPDWGKAVFSVDETGKLKLVRENYDTSG